MKRKKLFLGQRQDAENGLKRKKISKDLYNKGQAYMSNNLRKRDAREVKEGSKNTCKRKYKNKISLDQRTGISNAYWCLGDRQSQWNFLTKCVKIDEPQWGRARKINQKGHPKVYTFEVNNEEVTVCEMFFTHISCY